MIIAILLLAVSSSSAGWTTATRHLSHLEISKTLNLLRTRRLAVLKNTSAATIVVKQLAWLSVKPDLEFLAREVMGYLEPIMDGFLGHLMVVKQDGRPAEGVLMDCCFNYPKKYAAISDLIWGTAYLLFSFVLSEHRPGGRLKSHCP